MKAHKCLKEGASLYIQQRLERERRETIESTYLHISKHFLIEKLNKK